VGYINVGKRVSKVSPGFNAINSEIILPHSEEKRKRREEKEKKESCFGVNGKCGCAWT
jgi:hypothetical protein